MDDIKENIEDLLDLLVCIERRDDVNLTLEEVFIALKKENFL